MTTIPGKLELIPMKGVEDAIEALEPGSKVTVTCSPVKGVDATLEMTERLIGMGHTAIPHIAARMVTDLDHLKRIGERLEALEVKEVFVIAGDRQEPLGPFEGAASLIEELLRVAPFLTCIGITGYPEGHPMLDDKTVRDALLQKQQILADAGVSSYVATQMCFSAATIRSWIETERAAGLELPIHLGVPGVVDRARLMNLGVRLGVGSSLRYLRKNRKTVTKLMTKGSYEPGDILGDLYDDMAALGIDGVHFFTFNQVGATLDWMKQNTDRVS